MERKEAIEIVRKLYNKSLFLKKDKEAMVTLIPELEDSEDEKIRKEMITYLSTVEDKELIPYESWIAWLEKQSEQKPAEWSKEDTEMFGSISSTLSMYMYNTDIPSDIREIHKKEYAWFNELYNRVSPQPKQECSEDTQQWIDAIIKDYEGWYDTDKDHRATIQAKINILKSLRPQSTWKPSDEQMEVLVWCKPLFVDPKSKSILESLINELKKLREE